MSNLYQIISPDYPTWEYFNTTYIQFSANSPITFTCQYENVDYEFLENDYILIKDDRLYALNIMQLNTLFSHADDTHYNVCHHEKINGTDVDKIKENFLSMINRHNENNKTKLEKHFEIISNNDGLLIIELNSGAGKLRLQLTDKDYFVCNQYNLMAIINKEVYHNIID